MAATFHLTATGTFVLQSAGGATLHEVNVNQAGTTSATITLYDNNTAAGQVIAVIDTTAKGQSRFDTVLTKGLTAVVAGATAGDITVVLQ